MASTLTFIVNILVIILLVALFYYAVKYLQTEGFVNSPIPLVYFLSADETREVLINDRDEYVHTLNQWDLIARKVATFQDYINKIANSAMNFTPDQKVKIEQAAYDADSFFKSLRIDGLDTEQLTLIPWKICLTRGKEYEDGLPHTRGDKIFLSTDIDIAHTSLVSVLIHEKVHVYQRMYPQDTMSFLQHNGYYRWKQRYGVPRIRSNPDLDPWIYFHPQNKKPMVAFYTCDNPENINDVVLDSPEFEHPFEQIAYKIAQKYKQVQKQSGDKYKNMNFMKNLGLPYSKNETNSDSILIKTYG
jgi:hypothetical protein